MHEKLAQAISEKNFSILPPLLEQQEQMVLANQIKLDCSAKQEIQETLEHCLLLAKLSRAHCLDAILINQRKLAVLSAYQSH